MGSGIIISAFCVGNRSKQAINNYHFHYKPETVYLQIETFSKMILHVRDAEDV